MTQTKPEPMQATPLDQMQDRLDFARKLQELTNKIHGTDNVGQIMLGLSKEISELFLCERLTLYVYDKERKALVSRVKTGIDSNKDLVLPVDRRSIAGYVAATKTTVRIDNLDDAEELKRIDPQLHFFSQVDHATGFKSKQMLAAPLLLAPRQELVGVLQLINQRIDGRFDKVAEEGVEALTATLALALSKRMQAAAILPERYEALIEQGVIAAPELDLAQRWAQRKGKNLEQVLVEDFNIGLDAMGRAMAKAAGTQYQGIADNWTPNPELLKKTNRANAVQYNWLPYSIDQNLVTLISTDPGNRQTQENLHRTFPYNQVMIRLTTLTDFSKAMTKAFPDPKPG